MTAGLAQLRDRARRYGAALHWMLRDALTHFRAAMLQAVSASVFGVLLQGGVLGIVLVYARHLESGDTMRLAGHALDPRTSAAFVAVGSFAAVVLIASAALIFVSKRTIASLSVHYEKLCSRRVLEAYGVQPQERIASHATRRILRAVLREQGQHARSCGRALMTVMVGAYPLIILLYMTAFLLVLNTEATLVLGLVASLFFWGHYRLNVDVAENEMQLKRLTLKSMFGVRRAMNAILPLGRLHSTVGTRVAAAYDAGNVREFFDRVRLRRTLAAQADFLGNLLIAVATGGVVIYLGHLALSGSLSWGGVIAYIVALRITVSGARSVLNGLAGYARWYPGVRAYRDLIGAGPVPRAGDPALLVVNRTGRGDVKEIALQPGDVAAILSPVALTRFTLFHFTGTLLGARAAADWDFVPTHPRLTEGTTLRDLLGGGAGFDDLLRGCDDAAFCDQLRALCNADPACVLDSEFLLKLDDAQLVKLTLLALSRRPARGVFIAAAAWDTLTAAERPVWLRALADRIVFIHFGREVAAPGAVDEKVVVIGNRTGQIALATCAWVQAHEQKLLESIRIVPRERRPRFALGAARDDGDDELEEGT